ncbi:hypothetical protein [Haloplanus natans]|uniref:hypothetical protein n=1 Tax=Haloplanus natans TaxID=376171 RepID=UPI0006782234|nr:hypothetical protein [Haloplanus natans]
MAQDGGDGRRHTPGVTAGTGGPDGAAVTPSDSPGASSGDDPDALCYDGERVLERAPLGAGWAAVTTHRVLAYNPAADGRRFEAVDRPNVSGVSVDATGERRLLDWGLRAAVYGLAGLGGGVALRAMDLGETLSMGAEAGAGAAPVGSVLAVTDTLAAALSLLTTLLLLGGIALVVGSLGILARYLRTRRPALVVDRFGDDPVRLPAPRGDGERAANALSAALGRD